MDNLNSNFGVTLRTPSSYAREAGRVEVADLLEDFIESQLMAAEGFHQEEEDSFDELGGHHQEEEEARRPRGHNPTPIPLENVRRML